MKIAWPTLGLTMVLLVTVLLVLHLASFNLGLGHDECGIILTALRNMEWDFNPEYTFSGAFAKAMGYTRGGLTIIWTSAVLWIVSSLGVPLTTFVTVLTASIPLLIAAFFLFLSARSYQKSTFFSAFIAGLFLLSPGIMGYYRTIPIHASLIIMMKSALIFEGLRTRNDKTIGSLPYILIALLVHFDNGFLISCLQLFFFLLLYRALRNPDPVQLKRRIFDEFLRLTWNYRAIIPIVSFLGLIAIYKWPIGNGGILLHNSENIQMGLFANWDVFQFILVNAGPGACALMILTLSQRFRGGRATDPELVAFSWLILSSMILLWIRRWENVQGYLPVAILPFYFFIAVGLKESKTFGMVLVALTLNASLCLYTVHGPIPSKQRIYGERFLHHQVNYYKGIGYILRQSGMNPLEQRKISPERRSVTILDGEPPLDKPFFDAIYYFGTAPRNAITPHTRFIVERDHVYWNSKLRAELGLPLKFSQLGFSLTDIVIDKGKAVAWLYSRCFQVCPPERRHSLEDLMEAWDELYANRQALVTVDWTVP